MLDQPGNVAAMTTWSTARLRRRPAHRATDPGEVAASTSARTVIIVVLLGITAGFLALVVLALLSRLVGWDVLAGVATGIGLSWAAGRLTGWNRTRHLNELLDWLDQDFTARRLADQATTHIRRGMP